MLLIQKGGPILPHNISSEPYVDNPTQLLSRDILGVNNIPGVLSYYLYQVNPPL